MIANLKPYPAMKDSGVPSLGEVPEHWQVKPLAQLGRLLKGVGGTKDDATEEGVPCVRYGDLYTTHTYFIRRSRTFITPERAREYTPIIYGDVLFAASGETLDEIGKSAVNLLKGRACCGGDVICLRPRVEVHAPYMGYATDCRSAIEQKASMGRGTTVKHIYPDQLKRLVICLPPLPEQAAVARFLDCADRRIRRYIRAKEELIRLLEEQLIVRAAESMRHPRCVTERLERLVVQHLRSITRDGTQLYVALGLYNRGRGIFHKKQTLGAELGDSTFFWVEPGDLVISGQFAWEGAVALASHAEKDKIVSHRYYLLRGIEGRSTTPYLWALLRSDLGTMLLDQHSRGAAGRNRPLNLRALLKEHVPVPPFEEQLALNALVQSLAPIREEAALGISLVREYRARLIADVVTGKLDVRDAAAKLPEEANEPEAVDDAGPPEESEEDVEAGVELATEEAEA